MTEILVTGGRGFIGREVVSHLMAAGHVVRVLDNMAYAVGSDDSGGAKLIKGSVGDPEVLRRAFAGVGGCVHLAGSPVMANPRAASGGNPAPFMAAAAALFDEAARVGVPVVYASSAAVYGVAETPRISETHPTVPANAHGAEKLALEVVARRYAEDRGVASVGLRMFNVFGPGQSPHSPYCGVVRLFAEKILHNEEAVIRGDGSQARDFIYVSDAARAICLALGSMAEGAQAVNICSGRAVTILDVAGALETAAGRVLRRRHEAEVTPSVAVSVGDPALAERLFGFKAEVDFDAGVRSMFHALESSSG